MLLFRWLLNAIALLAVAYVVPGFTVSSLYTALIVALVLGIINTVIKPILVLVTLPITILTLGLSTLLINALLLWFVSTIIKGFTIQNFGAALLGGLILSVISWGVSMLTRKS